MDFLAPLSALPHSSIALASSSSQEESLDIDSSLSARGKGHRRVVTSLSFRNSISSCQGSIFPSEFGRYQLYVSYACPWASRCLAVLRLKGLEEAIGVTVAKPTWEKTRLGEEHTGWTFVRERGEVDGCEPNRVNSARFVRDLYDLELRDYEVEKEAMPKYSVPVLWDKASQRLVNNESEDIMRILNGSFDVFAKNPDINLYPEALRRKIDDVNAWVLSGINSGVYKCKNAKTHEECERTANNLFDALDRCESILSSQRYLVGNVITEADIRLFVTLIRFDEVYAVQFLCNQKLIQQYPNLFNYTKDIYQLPGMKETVKMSHIRKHFLIPNSNGIIPIGPGIDYSLPHDRSRLASAAL